MLKGNRFYLNSGGIQSWFDGTTQWSYLESSEEVNVSNPTPDELQTINPYALLSIYKSGYNYKYTAVSYTHLHDVIEHISNKEEFFRCLSPLLAKRGIIFWGFPS